MGIACPFRRRRATSSAHFNPVSGVPRHALQPLHASVEPRFAARSASCSSAAGQSRNGARQERSGRRRFQVRECEAKRLRAGSASVWWVRSARSRRPGRSQRRQSTRSRWGRRTPSSGSRAASRWRRRSAGARAARFGIRQARYARRRTPVRAQCGPAAGIPPAATSWPFEEMVVRHAR